MIKLKTNRYKFKVLDDGTCIMAEMRKDRSDQTEPLSKQLIALQDVLHQYINRVEGDQYNVSFEQQIKDCLAGIDKNPESKNINSMHFDKLILLSQVACSVITQLSQYISNLNVRYTSKNANKNLLDKMLHEFSLEIKPTKIKLPEKVLEKMNK